MPSTTSASPPSHTPEGSPAATGPSTIHLSASGMSRPRHEAATAESAATARVPRTGRTYGHRRSSERTAE